MFYNHSAVAAMSADVFAIFSNGPVVAGAVMSSESFAGSRDGFWAGPGIWSRDTIEGVAKRIAKVAPARVAIAIAHLNALVAMVPSIATATARCDNEPKWLADLQAEGDLGEVDTSEGYKDAFSLVVVCKVNFWKTNHHTGQGRPAGYLNKLLASWAITNLSEEALARVWCASHWVDTRVALAGLGISVDTSGSPADAVANFNKLIQPSEDALLRIRSNPAGTAKWADAYAAIRYAASSADGAVILKDFPSLDDDHEEISEALKSGAAEYHIGAQYLTGKPRIILPDFPETQVVAAVSVIRTKAPQHSLLSAHSLSSIAADATVTARIANIAKNRADADAAVLATISGSKDALVLAAKVSATARGRNPAE